jgi:CheY-like chemotaxis protein
MAPNVILFADDSVDDRFLMLEAAKKAGIADAFVSVSDGEEAIAYLEKAEPGKGGSPSLAILDLSMPRKTGFETLDWIRQSPRWKTLPVLILTASTHRGDARSAYLLGANGFMIKPTTLQELMELVAALKAFWLRFIVVPPSDDDLRPLL